MKFNDNDFEVKEDKLYGRIDIIKYPTLEDVIKPVSNDLISIKRELRILKAIMISILIINISPLVERLFISFGKCFLVLFNIIYGQLL